ncbi:MAG: iron uptake porin, partial [Elainellaceae cyanobacterium]
MVAMPTSAIASELEQGDMTQLNQYAAEGEESSLSQVTSVSQLSDVQPTDWAFQALQNLISRYGCIAGYPDGTYRGFTALSRYEFAAGLNACLNNITANLDQIQLNQQDIATLNRLQQQFAADLATLRGRVDSLEARTAELEANQFSTTTKLNGEVIFAQQFVFDNDPVFEDDQATFGYRVRMNFDTSFTGEDRLRTRFQARDLPDVDGDPVGRSFSGGGGGDFVLDDLVYTFPLGPAEIVVGANSISGDDFVASTISPLDSASSGSVSDFGFPAQYSIAVPGDAGLGAVVQLTDFLSFDFGYSAGDA